MSINYPCKGGKLNSRRESDEALREGKTTLMAHTHVHEFHTGTHLRKYKIIGRWVQDHAPKTEYHVQHLRQHRLTFVRWCQKGAREHQNVTFLRLL